MHRRHFIAVALWAALAVALQAPVSVAQGAGTDDWIATWTASPQPIWDADFLAPIKVPRNLWNQTVRQMATVSDAVLDFDAVVRNPGRPTYVQAIYDAGDHLHPNDAGYKAMAESIDLKLLTGNR